MKILTFANRTKYMYLSTILKTIVKFAGHYNRKNPKTRQDSFKSQINKENFWMSPNTQQPSTLKTTYNQNDAKGGCFMNFKDCMACINRTNRWNAFCEWPGVSMCAHEHEIYLLSSSNISSCWLVVIIQIKELNPLTGYT